MGSKQGKSDEELDEMLDRAVSFLNTKKYDDSIRLFQELVQYRLKDERIWGSFILALLGAERWDEARKAHREAKELLGGDRIPEFTGPIDNVYRYASMLDHDGEDKLAEKLYTMLIQAMPQNEQYWIRLAQFYVSRARINDAIDVLQRANFNAEELWTHLGTSLWEMRKFEKAIEARRNATLVAPNSFQAWMLLAMDCYRFGDQKEGAKALARARELSKDSSKNRRTVDNFVMILQVNRDQWGERYGEELEL